MLRPLVNLTCRLTPAQVRKRKGKIKRRMTLEDVTRRVERRKTTAFKWNKLLPQKPTNLINEFLAATFNPSKVTKENARLNQKS